MREGDCCCCCCGGGAGFEGLASVTRGRPELAPLLPLFGGGEDKSAEEGEELGMGAEAGL